MAADLAAMPDSGERQPAVKAWLTGKARPAAARWWARAKAATAVQAFPGLYAAAALSLAAGGLIGHFVHGVGPWVTLAVTGWFALRFDSRLG